VQRRRDALNLRAAGANFRQIADALGVSVAQAYADVQSEMHALTRESAEQVLTVDLHRLDQLQAAVWPDARAGNVQAIQAATKIIELRQRLFGNLRSAGMTVTVPQTPGSVLVIEGDKQSYIAGLRAARGELEPPATATTYVPLSTSVDTPNGNGNGHH
jgi:hypothetical protein